MTGSEDVISQVDEGQLVGRISKLSNEVQKIESFCGRSLHTIIMRNEIEALQDQLSSAREQTDTGADQDHETVDTPPR